MSAPAAQKEWHAPAVKGRISLCVLFFLHAAAMAAYELAPHGIRVNAISPGTIDTPFHEVFSTPEMMRGFAAATPLGRVGTSKSNLS